MKTPSLPSLRDRQREETRVQILRAVGRQLENGTLEEVGFAEIARDAGVGERTVYRYFPTKDALLGAFWALPLIHISEPTRLLSISYAVFCLKKKNTNPTNTA